MPSMRTFSIRRVTEDRVSAVEEFQAARPSEYLWPRTLEALLELAKEERLHEAVEDVDGSEVVVGICYVTEGESLDGQHRFEFGGINVDEGCRELGVAAALGTIAITSHFAWDPIAADGDLIAHVHEDNLLPRNLLKHKLGFIETGEKEVPPVEPPASMKRNAEGKVVGDVFKLERMHLAVYADWLEDFAGTIEGRRGTSTLRLSPAFTSRKSSIIEALRDLAT